MRAILCCVQYCKEDWKMIDIYALGPLVIATNLINGCLMKEGSMMAMIISQDSHVA